MSLLTRKFLVYVKFTTCWTHFVQKKEKWLHSSILHTPQRGRPRCRRRSPRLRLTSPGRGVASVASVARLEDLHQVSRGMSAHDLKTRASAPRYVGAASVDQLLTGQAPRAAASAQPGSAEGVPLSVEVLTRSARLRATRHARPACRACMAAPAHAPPRPAPSYPRARRGVRGVITKRHTCLLRGAHAVPGFRYCFCSAGGVRKSPSSPYDWQ